MEKVKFKVVLGALSFAFFLLLGMNRVEAQSSSTTVGTGVPGAKPGSPLVVMNAPQGNFVNSTEADDRLAAAMADLKGQLAAYPPSNSIYTAIELNYTYYSEIDRLLEGGMSVQNSIGQGLGIFVSDVNPVSTNVAQQLRQMAINLLSN